MSSLSLSQRKLPTSSLARSPFLPRSTSRALPGSAWDFFGQTPLIQLFCSSNSSGSYAQSSAIISADFATLCHPGPRWLFWCSSLGFDAAGDRQTVIPFLSLLLHVSVFEDWLYCPFCFWILGESVPEICWLHFHCSRLIGSLSSTLTLHQKLVSLDQAAVVHTPGLVSWTSFICRSCSVPFPIWRAQTHFRGEVRGALKSKVRSFFIFLETKGKPPPRKVTSSDLL